MRRYNIVLLFTLVLLSFILVGCGGSPPTKTILDIEEGEVAQEGNPMSERSIVDSQGNILYSKDLSQPGGLLRDLFIKDNTIIGKPTIGSFIRSQGAKTNGERNPSDYYPISIEELLKENNIFNGDYWSRNEGLENLKQLERENLRLSQTRKALNQRDKNFSIEDDRICIQGGRIISNMLYYKSENSACYGKGDANCKPYFAEFPFFKSCSSLTNLKETFTVPSEWDDYSVSCNFNSKFSTIPSFLRNVNVGYSHCLLKNNENSQDSILVGYGVGNSHLENSTSLELNIENIFNNFEIESREELSNSQIIVKNTLQKIENLGKKTTVEQTIYECYGKDDCGNVVKSISSPITDEVIEEIVNEKEDENYQLLSNPLRGTLHIGSYQDKVSSNYLLFESIAEKEAQIKEYRVNLENGEEYYVYMDNYSSWYAASTNQLDINAFYNSYEKTNQLPPRTAERILIQKVEDGKNYTLTEESETLYYKSNHLFNIDLEDSYTTLPIYILQIEGVESDACDYYFANYDYKTDSLDYEDALMCRVEDSTLTAHLSERFFSNRYSAEENNEIGLGYMVMRNILYPN